MKAMVLCAGLGTRLRPLTERWPKPAIPLLGQPIFRYALGVLRHAGVTGVGINTHHLPGVMEEVARAEAQRAGLPLTVVQEPIIQGTGGGIRGLRALLSDDVFIVYNGDILFPLDLVPLVAEHRASGAVASMVLLPMPEKEKFSAVELDAQGSIRRIAGKGPGGERLSSWHFSGVHLFSPEVFDFMAPEGPDDILQTYQRMIEKGVGVRGLRTQAYWSDLGTPARYLATLKDLLFRQVPLELLGDASPFASAQKGTGNYWAGPEARIDGAVAGPAYFAAGARVEAGAQLGSAVYLGPGARVGKGARLNRVAVLDETEIAPGEELVEVIAWKHHRIPAALTGP